MGNERRALPEGWEWKRLGDIGILHDGDWILNKDYSKNGVRLIQVGDIGIREFIGKSQRYISIKKAEELKCTFVNSKEDILISRMPDPIGRACLSPNLPYPYIVAVDVTIFKINEKLAEPRYIVYSLNNPKLLKEIDKYALGATRKRISRKNLERIEIPLPPLPTQRRIVSILEKAEETKKLRAQADGLTNQLLQSVFLETFGDSMKNPKKWKKYKLKDIIQEFRYGTSVKSSESGYPVLRIPNVVDGKINLNELKYCKVTFDEYEKLRLQEGDVLFVRTNGNQDYVGRCAIVKEIQKDFIFASYLIRARLKQEIISPYYLKNYLFTEHGKNLIKSKTKTTAGQFNINTQGLGSIEILVPPLPLQQKFARVVEKVESMRQSQAQSKQQIEDLFSALMQKAFRGEI